MNNVLPAVLDVLPHGPRVCYLTEVTELIYDGDKITGAYGYYDFPDVEALRSPDHPHGHLLDHVRNRALLGGNTQAEIVALTGCYAAMQMAKYHGRFLSLLKSDHDLTRVVNPGERLEIEVHLDYMGKHMGRGSGIASVAGELACRVNSLKFGIVDLSELGKELPT